MASVFVNRRVAEAGQLPPVCICCGNPATRQVRHRFWYLPTWMLIFNILPFRGVSLFSVSYADLAAPVCSRHGSRLKLPVRLKVVTLLIVLLGIFAAAGLLIGGVVLLNQPTLAIPGVIAFFVMFLSVLVMSIVVFAIEVNTPRAVTITSHRVELVAVADRFAAAAAESPNAAAPKLGAGGTAHGPASLPAPGNAAPRSGPSGRTIALAVLGVSAVVVLIACGGVAVVAYSFIHAASEAIAQHDAGHDDGPHLRPSLGQDAVPPRAQPADPGGNPAPTPAPLPPQPAPRPVPPPPRPVLPAPEPIASVEQALASAESSDARRSREAFDWLKSNPSDEKRAEVCAHLLRMLNSPRQRPAGETLLIWASAEQIPELAAALAAASAERKHDAARPIAQSLAKLDDPRVYPALAAYLAADFDTGAARDALKLAGPKAAPVIVPYLHDMRRGVREAARGLLVHDWEVDPNLLIEQTAADLSAGDADKKKEALDWINSLPPGGSLGDKLAVALDPLLHDADVNVARKALSALRRCVSAGNVGSLIALLDNADDGLRNGAKDLLVQLKDPRAAPHLARGLGGDFFQRVDARKRLHDFGPAAEAYVVPYYENKDWIARKDVCELLGEIGTSRSIPALQRMMRDENLHVRNAAQQAIAKITEAKRKPVDAPVGGSPAGEADAPAPSAPVAGVTRIWTDATGLHKIEAEFVDFRAGKVVLKKTDGSEVSLLMQQLGKDDQNYVRELLKSRR